MTAGQYRAGVTARVGHQRATETAAAGLVRAHGTPTALAGGAWRGRGASAALRPSAVPVRRAEPLEAPRLSAAPLSVIQPELRIGALGDSQEREADRVADQVTRMPSPPAVPAASPLQVVPPSSTLRGGGELQKQPAGSQGAFRPSTVVHDVLRFSGQPLDAAARAYFEPRFGHDFSRIRVHSGDAADESARRLNANAYTVGENIVFRAGQFALSTQEGRWLLAHELAHVVQQQSTGEQQIHRQRASSGFSVHIKIGDATRLDKNIQWHFDTMPEKLKNQLVSQIKAAYAFLPKELSITVEWGQFKGSDLKNVGNIQVWLVPEGWNDLVTKVAEQYGYSHESAESMVTEFDPKLKAEKEKREKEQRDNAKREKIKHENEEKKREKESRWEKLRNRQAPLGDLLREFIRTAEPDSVFEPDDDPDVRDTLGEVPEETVDKGDPITARPAIVTVPTAFDDELKRIPDFTKDHPKAIASRRITDLGYTTLHELGHILWVRHVEDGNIGARKKGHFQKSFPPDIMDPIAPIEGKYSDNFNIRLNFQELKQLGGRENLLKSPIVTDVKENPTTHEADVWLDLAKVQYSKDEQEFIQNAITTLKSAHDNSKTRP